MEWYAVYTCPRHEKYVAKQLNDRRLESFAALYRSVHQWKDRRKTVEVAVSFNGRPATLPTAEVEALRAGFTRQMHMEPCAYLHTGDRVHVVRGPLIGAQGILVHIKGKLRVVITLDVLMRSVAVEIDAADVEALHL